ncbi:restriction endonuclease subunit S [Salmonella enterica subsp. indica]|nr:restriction endonuclease subunit S [Salmonella enterica subsp. indica]EEJ9030716.1 restriction endonuclease subunit S [Salmonella enterica subsp. enterica serovar Oslo]EEJ9033757.1 restriction endonuclease subunit S [Salmonella enterica subsp. enterica serovar Oslo]
MSVGKKVPEIRFERFSGLWYEVALSSVIDIRSGKDYKHLGKGNIPVYGTGGYMLSVDSALSKNEDAIGIGRKGTIDKPYILRAPFWTVDTLFYALPLPSFNLDFLFCLFQKIEWKKHDESTGVPSLSKIAINNVLVYVTNELEQTAIGNIFKKLDTLINQHQQKHDKLSNFKKSMLEKMFPKQGKTMPEIRFKGFSGEWKEKELGELAEIVRGASPRPIEDPKWFDNQSNVGWLRIRDVTEQDGRIHYLEQRISKLGQEKTRVLHEKHLLLSIAASVGKPVINYVQTGVHDGFLIFKKPLFELEFMYQWLKSFEAKWQQFGQPGSQVNLNSDIVKSQTVTIPTKEEQIAIGNYFQKLDDLINRHQQQITKLNTIKQACLSKMFV